MNKEEKTKDFVEKLEERGFFSKYCEGVCPHAMDGECMEDVCPLSEEDKMTLWTRDPKPSQKPFLKS